jgi:hypothetical protein
MLTKCHVDKMPCGKIIMWTKCQIGKMTHGHNAICENVIGTNKMSLAQDVIRTKGQVDKMSLGQNVKLIKWHGAREAFPNWILYRALQSG